jgi:hypothetical protein
MLDRIFLAGRPCPAKPAIAGAKKMDNQNNLGQDRNSGEF